MIKLRRQRLIMRQHHRRAPRLLDDLGHGVGLARAGHPQQHLVLLRIKDAASKLLDGVSLVALGFVVAVKFEVHEIGLALPGCNFEQGESFYYIENRTTAEAETRRKGIISPRRGTETRSRANAQFQLFDSQLKVSFQSCSSRNVIFLLFSVPPCLRGGKSLWVARLRTEN